MPTIRPRQQHDLPLFMIIGWGLGTLPIALLFNTFNALALRYFTDVLGVAAAAAGSLIALSKLYDAFTDPVMGWLSDRTKTRFGKRRPYLFLGAIICAASIAMMFSIAEISSANPQSLLFVALILYATGYTVYNVPYLAMPPEMSLSGKTRSALMSWRVFAIGGGALVAGTLAPALVKFGGGGAEGHSLMGLTIAAMILAAGFITVVLLRGAPEVGRVSKPEKISLKEQFKTVASNRPFATLMGTKLFLLLAVAFAASTMAFFTVWVLGRDYGTLSIILLCMTAAQIVATPVWLWIYRRIGPKNTFLLSALIFAGVSMTWLWADSSEALWLIYLRAVAKGLGAGGVLLVGQALLPDVIEFDRLTSSQRREGVLSGIYTTIEKLAFAFASALLGFWLQFRGYVPQLNPRSDIQPDTAIAALNFCQSVFPAFFIIVAAIIIRWYSIDEERLIELRNKNQQ